MSGNHQKEANNIELDSIEDAIAAIKAGEVIIVVDDEDRENEGDFICAADKVTPEIINFMATYGRGLICTPIDEKRADELELNMMVSNNTALHETAFTVSIDLVGQGCTTGISAYDRSTGIRALVDPKTKASDFARPGHIFPLRAKTGGVLRRTGHTEAAIDLSKLAGFSAAGVLVEILNEDGSMARLPQLIELAAKHDLKLISIKDLVEYRMRNERIVKKELSVEMDSPYGKFMVHAFTQLTTGDTHLAISKGELKADEPILVRVHSNTETGDVIGNLFQGKAKQLENTMKMIACEETGILLYMRHGEKQDAILNHLKAIAKVAEPDPDSIKTTSEIQRDYGVGAQILRELGVNKIRLISNNPKRRVALPGYGLEIVEMVSLQKD